MHVRELVIVLRLLVKIDLNFWGVDCGLRFCIVGAESRRGLYIWVMRTSRRASRQLQ